MVIVSIDAAVIHALRPSIHYGHDLINNAGAGVPDQHFVSPVFIQIHKFLLIIRAVGFRTDRAGEPVVKIISKCLGNSSGVQPVGVLQPVGFRFPGRNLIHKIIRNPFKLLPGTGIVGIHLTLGGGIAEIQRDGNKEIPHIRHNDSPGRTLHQNQICPIPCGVLPGIHGIHIPETHIIREEHGFSVAGIDEQNGIRRAAPFKTMIHHAHHVERAAAVIASTGQ